MCCLITHSIMKKSIDELSDEEFVQQLIAKLENLKTAHLLYLEKKKDIMKVIYPGLRILLMIMMASWHAKHPNVLQKQ